MDLCELEASLVYRASSRTAPKLQRNPVSKKVSQINKAKVKQNKNAFELQERQKCVLVGLIS